jgi:hypothetical protein
MALAGRRLAANVKIAPHCVHAARAAASRTPTIALASGCADMPGHGIDRLGHGWRRVLRFGDPRPRCRELIGGRSKRQQVGEMPGRWADIVTLPRRA